MNAALNKGLGKGLGALLPNAGLGTEDIRDSVVELKINDISPNADQPRKAFDQEKLEDLANSIRENGVIQPIIVCRGQPGYKIVTGERRWRASRMAGLSVIPAIIRELTDVQVLEQALIENIQRQDLNPLEEAYALDKLIKDHAMTQEKLSTVIGRSRPAIANTLRLLNLPDDIKRYVLNEELTAGHARALLSLTDYAAQKKAADLVRSRELSVRETEKLVKKMAAPPKPAKKADPAYILSVKEVERRLTSCLGTHVRLKDHQGKGTIQISYYSNEDLDRLLELIGSSQK
jgi:ParB family transcriptional regulator, chromosome partitioning protein